ncbi:MAG: EamA family transporter [Prevotellaceae bacterium]|jgi:undecaprenyl phosphate-alpha-L-ara4N flippase subunit ArnE|nr:EamA family transporter [Prevotellaceae bacterium]
MKVILLTTVQCLLLASGQVCFKLAVEKITKLQFSWVYLYEILTNWWLLLSGICLASATVLWGYVLKHFEFSVAYPVTAFSYIFGMLAAVFIFHEHVPPMRWIGAALIILGVIFIAK